MSLYDKTLKEGKVLVIDIETAGKDGEINFNEDLIVEIGITAVNVFTGEMTLIYDEIVNDGITIEHCNSWIFETTDLDFNAVLAASKLDKEYLYKLSQMYYATAFNKKFDFSFLKRCGIHFNELPCIMESATPHLKIPPTEKMKRWKPEIKYKNPNAEEAYKMLFPEKEYTELHRGGDDSVHEAEILKELYDKNAYHVEVWDER